MAAIALSAAAGRWRFGFHRMSSSCVTGAIASGSVTFLYTAICDFKISFLFFILREIFEDESLTCGCVTKSPILTPLFLGLGYVVSEF